MISLSWRCLKLKLDKHEWSLLAAGTDKFIEKGVEKIVAKWEREGKRGDLSAYSHDKKKDPLRKSIERSQEDKDGDKPGTPSKSGRSSTPSTPTREKCKAPGLQVSDDESESEDEEEAEALAQEAEELKNSPPVRMMLLLLLLLPLLVLLLMLLLLLLALKCPSLQVRPPSPGTALSPSALTTADEFREKLVAADRAKGLTGGTPLMVVRPLSAEPNSSPPSSLVRKSPRPSSSDGLRLSPQGSARSSRSGVSGASSPRRPISPRLAQSPYTYKPVTPQNLVRALPSSPGQGEAESSSDEEVLDVNAMISKTGGPKIFAKAGKARR